LYVAAGAGQLNAVRCLVEKLGADINQATDNGSTPLMIAAEHLHHTIV
jgi:ankyrin repeat protein